MKPDSYIWPSPNDVSKLFEKVKPYTYLVEAKLHTLLRLGAYLNGDGIPGDFVECGVYKGGSAAVLSRSLGPHRHLWLYDSFAGMPETSAHDGEVAKEWIGKCVASAEEVREVMTAVSTPPERYAIRQGWFHDSFVETRSSQVALLHCDCDWYESVSLVLETFYPLVPVGGCVILDDFGFWEGCRTAFYDFCRRHGEQPLLERVERDQAFWIKGRSSNRVLIPNLLDTHERETLERQQLQATLAELDQARQEIQRLVEEKTLPTGEPSRLEPDRETCIGATPQEELLGMIPPEERLYLREFAQAEYTGKGAIVDLGCWLGVSTIELARGLRGNPRAIARTSLIHAYDCFIWEAWMDQFVVQTQLHRRYQPGESFYQECAHRTQPWQEHIQFHPGDLTVLGWDGGPIEFLFIDAMKSWMLANSILRHFFPALVPHQSVIVHQDFSHFGTHWIHLIMYRLRHYFEPLRDIPHSWSFVFRYREAVPHELLAESYGPASFSVEEIEAAFEYSASIVACEKRAQLVGAKVMALLERGEISHARNEFARAKAANLSYGDLHLPLGLWFPSMIMDALGISQAVWEAANAQLDVMQREISPAQAQPLPLDCDPLGTSVETLVHTRRELNDTRVFLQQDREVIETLESARPWKRTRAWFRRKRGR